MSLATKIRAAWSSGSLWPRVRRYLGVRLSRPIEVAVGYAQLPREARSLDMSGYRDHRGEFIDAGFVGEEPRVTDVDLRRIMVAYQLAKRDQLKAPEAHQIRGIWAEFIAAGFGSLIDAVNAGDVDCFRDLLVNFHREPFTHGMGGDEFARYRRFMGRWYVTYVWHRYFRRILELEGELGPNDIYYPFVGNPAGPLFRGHVVTIETLRHVYHAIEAQDVLRGVRQPVIVEIGGGLGGQAYQTMLRVRDARYRIFDIPEVVMVSSYFLLAALPKNIRLYGEGPVDGGYEIGVFPHFAVDELADDSVDLFYNSASFSEMDARSAQAYLAVIERACRRYFMHDNHDLDFTFTADDGSVSKNLVGSKLVPDGQRFKRLYKKPRVHGLPEDRGIPHFQYLYERVDDDYAVRYPVMKDGRQIGHLVRMGRVGEFSISLEEDVDLSKVNVRVMKP